MKSTRERFDEMTLPVTESGCLLWVGCCNSHGYGVLSVNNAQRFAHRLAWEFSHGAIPDNRIVMHKCDVPCCVNVRHLSLGTYADNMADKMNKGRGNILKGSDQPSAKLTEEDVTRIRSSNERGVRLAERYGVSQAAISEARRGKTWRHLPR